MWSTSSSLLLLQSLALPLFVGAQCPEYVDYSTQRHEPFSSGRYSLSYQRPSEKCRTFKSQGVEDVLTRFKDVIKDPDLYRLFENAYPNTLDTAIKWKGTAAESDEELTFVITGDIDAMWLRDSSNQMQSYLPLLNASDSPDSIASLYRGVINLQARYLLIAPFCNSFQPPEESGIPPAENGAASDDAVFPAYDDTKVFECKYELDSLAAFLDVSSNYFNRTGDAAFFSRYRWRDAVNAVLNAAEAMTTPTYAPDGSVNASPYSFTRLTRRATETLANDGLGNPVASDTGLVRSAFRPSDDATIFQFLVPANMMFARYLSTAADIAAAIDDAALAARMRSFSASIRTAINTHAIIDHPDSGRVFAYEVDGFGSALLMDDANIPSLLSAPFLGYISTPEEAAVYADTRRLVLSPANAYFMRGPAISAVGGPHVGPGYAWPMAAIVRAAASDDAEEVAAELRQLVRSTDGLGLIHEGVNSSDASDWTRQWFSWANGLFGQVLIGLEERMPEVLGRSYQE